MSQAQARLVDYYAALNLPHDADLTGVENAYARISDELATIGDLDEDHRAALLRVNEAYAVLSKPELRRSYDAIFLAAERAAEQKRVEAEMRRRIWLQRMLLGALGVVVIAQAGGLIYLGHDQLADLLRPILGGILPGTAN
ncbi:MAG: J domain-containing protein [Hyphomicrobiales bacterium]